jgi:hypothetical protein
MASPWTEDYPSAAVLRREVESMVTSITEVLLECLPASEISGLYLKGSAHKPWDSPLDYVPEISDVDVHLLFRDDACVERRLGTIEAALAIQNRIEDRYHSKVRSPLHTPRPQLVILNRLLRAPDYSPSPPNTVSTLWGDEYPQGSYDEERERELARRRLLSEAEILQALPLRIADKPGAYLLAVMRDLTWRVSPAGPRVLCLHGMPATKVWSLNRTGVVSALGRFGEHDLLASYRRFYLSAWRSFLSGHQDSDAIRSAIGAGAEVIRLAAEIAR